MDRYHRNQGYIREFHEKLKTVSIALTGITVSYSCNISEKKILDIDLTEVHNFYFIFGKLIF